MEDPRRKNGECAREGDDKRDKENARKKEADTRGRILALCLMLHGGVMVGDWN